MLVDNKLYIGNANGEKAYIYLNKANRHGIIAGATGTGKTTTLRVIAESFSDAGVPVFLADAKGDLATLTQPGTQNENVQKRVDEMGLAADGFHFSSYPVTFWDVYQEMGLPLRATVSEVG
ncbi:MAG: helicase HerA-like domain-containing protein, partial [Acutalibacteraceae bacterium]|nr:helicase HerA-like domain-containing protein [Acutalibacteraceae bacterium]